MYKKAIRENLLFKSKFGNLSLQQLWQLKMGDLKALIKNAYADVKKLTTSDDEELSFLDTESVKENKETELTKLRYEILKDVYKTRQAEANTERENVAVDLEVKKLQEILARKQEAALENMSAEELEKKIAELTAKKK